MFEIIAYYLGGGGAGVINIVYGAYFLYYMT